MATIQVINIGQPNDNTGDPLRTAFDKTNQNNTALNNDLASQATAIGLKAPLANPSFSTDITVNGISVGRGNNNLNNLKIGNGSLNSNTTGQRNTAGGNQALQNNTSGENNTAIGDSALFSNTIKNYNTAIGYGAGSDNVSWANTTCLGANSLSTNNNQVNLGDTAITSLRCNVTSITSLSDKRDKTDIVEISEGLDFVSKLKPVTFTWNQRDGNRVGIKSAGFIAQDLLQLQNDSLIGENLDLVSEIDPEQLEARYANLMPIMIKAIQELKKEIELLKAK